MKDLVTKNLVLTSSFSTVAERLLTEGLLPKSAKVIFITTAGDPYPERPWVIADRDALIRLGYEVVDFDLKDKNEQDLEMGFSRSDIIFVAGGNTSYLAKHAHFSEFGTIIRKLLDQGKIYIGSSAGSILAGPTVEPFLKEDNREIGTAITLSETECLNLVEFIVLPHDQIPEFAAQHDKIIEEYKNLSFVRLNDGQYRVQ